MNGSYENSPGMIHRVSQDFFEPLISLNPFEPAIHKRFRLKNPERLHCDANKAYVASRGSALFGRDNRYNYDDRHIQSQGQVLLHVKKFEGDWFQMPMGTFAQSFLKLLVYTAIIVFVIHMWQTEPLILLAYASKILLFSVISYRMGLGWNPFNFENNVAGGGRYQY
ncbi:MAG: hypothetical protein NTY09_06310 [bacterium]|nr:hypothetical protein [bacterium]